MSKTGIQHLKVPGANLHYRVRGSGPVLLMVAGGAGGAESYDRISEYLAGHYTVVSYDRRGYSRSPLDDPGQPIGIETHSHDAHLLLEALTNEPACVFGCSIGALIGLDLAVHHPRQVRTLVAHEPPATELLSGSERPFNQDLFEMARRDGAQAALHKFAESIGARHGGAEASLHPSVENARSARHNSEAFFKYDAGAVARYKLDLAALKTTPTRLAIAGGQDGREYFPYRCAARLAEHLGTTLVEFPGNHAGFIDHPPEFAATLLKVLGNQAEPSPLP